MAKQKIVRIDYRLIHGQVVAKWIKYYPVNRIIVADDELKMMRSCAISTKWLLQEMKWRSLL